MEGKRPAQKVWDTMRTKSPGEKARDTIRRKKGAKKGATKIKDKQWEPKKVDYLKELKEKATPNTCIVCDDSRPFVLQVHHADPEKKNELKLCANCHDAVRRGTLENLREAHLLRHS